MKNACIVLFAFLALMSGAGPADAQQAAPADLTTILNYHEVLRCPQLRYHFLC